MVKLDVSHHPELIDPLAFVAPGAVVVGRVTLAAEASVWFGVVIRGDTEAIEVGPRTNVQDGCILHADPGLPCRLGAGVTLGHGAVVHGATVHDDVMIAMRATVLNGAEIGARSLVAAGAVVPPGMHVPPGSVVMGVPAQVVRTTTAADLERIREAAEHYVESARIYRDRFRGADAWPAGRTPKTG